MQRWTTDRHETSLDHARQIYQQALAGWASDCLTCRHQPIAWLPPDPKADFLDRDWTRLYSDSLLDD